MTRSFNNDQRRSASVPKWILIYAAVLVVIGTFLSVALPLMSRNLFGDAVVDTVGGQLVVGLLLVRTVVFTVLLLIGLIWRHPVFFLNLFIFRLLVEIFDLAVYIFLGFRADPAGDPLRLFFGMPTTDPGITNVIIYLIPNTVLIVPAITAIIVLSKRMGFFRPRRAD